MFLVGDKNTFFIYKNTTNQRNERHVDFWPPNFSIYFSKTVI